MKKRVVVAMSGGVDSSVAAGLLLEQGYEVIGVTMCFNLPDTAKARPTCCGIQGIEDARRVAHTLGIRHYVLNMQKDLQEKVIADFCREYLQGRTPNPCVRCNQYLKFDTLLKKALSLDAQFLATGHYSRIVKIRAGYVLKKGRDKQKDQSYFLYRLNQQQLKHTLFPLGDYTKEEVRKKARGFSLAVADKQGSQDICFLPGFNYREFIRGKGEIEPGLIIDKKGTVLGEHKGIAYYTVGQREGLGIALGYPAYITRIDAETNTITVGEKEDAFAREFIVGEPNFICRPLKKKIALKVRIRYNHKEMPAEVFPEKTRLRVCFKRAQFAITPGQSAVFYQRDQVIGGGIIERQEIYDQECL